MTTYNDLTYVVLDNKLKIHQRHLQFLAIEVYNSRNKLNPCFMKKAYVKKNIPYCLRIGLTLLVSCANTRIYGINFLKFRGNVLWNNLAVNLKECQSLLEFKLLLKQNGGLSYTCSACII